MHVAVLKGNIEILKFLFSQCPLPSGGIEEVFHLASSVDNLDILEIMIVNGHCDPSKLNAGYICVILGLC